MEESIKVSEFDSSNIRRVKKVKEFLDENGLELSSDIEIFVTLKENNEMIACGGLSGKVLKCIAVANERRGEGLILKVMTHLLNAAYSRGRKELFLFSTPKNIEFFRDCGFNLIEECDGEIILMENTDNLKKYQEELSTKRVEGDKIGTIVMNANPFTLGHRYLVEESAKRCDWLHLFVVKEDLSEFKFEDRIRLIREGTSHIKNITIHEGSDYIISNATFPTYFIKDKGKINELHAKLDLNVFRNRLAPYLGITHRFVGTEPYCKVTNNYNQNMKKILADPNGKANPIEVVEIDRVEFDNDAISASRVRRLLKENNFEELKNIVPPTTYKFLKENYEDYK
ncbi:[citrate (pro-3S)-lyase] ligase [Sulfurospirillum sp. 1307]|jgi:[citrate (pro-3S)-lyase] ligase